MDKKKIAVFSTGWSGEILYEYLKGVNDGMKGRAVDIYAFLSHAVFGPAETELRGETNIYNLPNMKDFDAALIFANGLDFPDILENINNRCIEANIPVVYTGKDDERFYFAGADNSVGTKELCRHLVEVHDVKDVWFIAGSAENMDSNTRMRAVKEVLADYSLELKEENICYTNWSPYVAYTYVMDRINRGDKKPDAIICANDTLAMVLCAEFSKVGIKVPEDIIVTGFDNESMAQLYDPSISSVDQRFDNIGKKCANILCNVFDGNEIDRAHRIECEFIPSESCGCHLAKDFNAIRRMIGKQKFEERIFNSNFDIKLTNMERVILQGNDFKHLTDAFTSLNDNSAQYEGNTFHVMIDPLVEKSIGDSQRELRREGYPAVMNMVYSKDKGYVYNDCSFETKKIVPQLNPHSGNRLYIILPLHDGEYSLGYVVFGDDTNKIKDSQLLRRYMERINIILGRYFQKLRLNAVNQRLMQMTETDAMTHVKNRTAFETRLGDLQNKICSENKPQFALVLFDINNLKYINDNLGHEAGDEYIINSCRLICKIFKKSAVYRIGGDEFVVVLERDDYTDREKLYEAMQEEMEHLKNEDVPIYEKISVASGMAVYDFKEDYNVSDVFNRADAAMYENKAIMKGKKTN